MKILILQTLNNSLGGGSYSIIKFFEYLSTKGHTVYLYGMNKNHLFFRKNTFFKNFNLITRTFVSEKLKGSRIVNLLINKIDMNIKLRKLITNKQIDYIVGSLTQSSIDAVQLAEKTGIKSVNFVFECPPWMERDLGAVWKDEFNLKNQILWEKTKKAYLKSNILISNSKISKIECEKWIDSNVDDFIYPGIDIKNIEKIKTNKKKYQIIYVGRLYKTKNIDKIILSLSKIKNAPKLKLIGSGEELKNLKKLATKINVNVEFLGILSDNEKFKEIKKSQLMVFPSSHEGFGMPPMEALACGIPCICSDKDIFKEVYGDHVIYFKNNNIDDLTKKIKNTLNDIKYKKLTMNKSKKNIKNNYSWKKSGEKIEKILLDK